MSKDGYGLEARKQLGDLMEVYQLCHEGWGALFQESQGEHWNQADQLACTCVNLQSN